MNSKAPSPSDHEKTQRACELLLDLIAENLGKIEPSVWVRAMIILLAEGLKRSGVPFEEFKKAIMACAEHHKEGGEL